MNKDDLVRFHLEQMDIVKQNRVKLEKQGYVKGYQDVYPDIYERLMKKKGVAYIRGEVSVKLMALLYDTLVLFIPPLPKDQIEKRFFLTWEELIILCQQGIVIPIIGDAQSYTAPHFDDLFTKLPAKPSSLWARGLSLLDVFHMEETLDEARRILPVDAVRETCLRGNLFPLRVKYVAGQEDCGEIGDTGKCWHLRNSQSIRRGR